MIEFIPFPKLARLSRECVITEKIDGTNACIYIGEAGEFAAGSRNRWITPESDNYGFAAWAYANKEELLKLGPGRHFGEWWGCGIQRGYGLKGKVFSLFNTTRWDSETPERTPPACCRVVPVIWRGEFASDSIDDALKDLEVFGSMAAPGFMRPEGIVCYHIAAGLAFKKTLDGDGHKGAK